MNKLLYKMAELFNPKSEGDIIAARSLFNEGLREENLELMIKAVVLGAKVKDCFIGAGIERIFGIKNENIFEFIIENIEYKKNNNWLSKGFKYASELNNSSLLKHIISHEKYDLITKDRENINTVFRILCGNANFEMVKYIVDNVGLKSLDLYSENESKIKCAFQVGCGDIVEFLIFECGYEFKDKIINELREIKSGIQIDDFVRKVELKKLNEKLNENIVVNENNEVKKMKI